MFIAAVSRQNLETTKTSIKGKGTTLEYYSAEKKKELHSIVCVSHIGWMKTQNDHM